MDVFMSVLNKIKDLLKQLSFCVYRVWLLLPDALASRAMALSPQYGGVLQISKDQLATQATWMKAQVTIGGIDRFREGTEAQ